MLKAVLIDDDESNLNALGEKLYRHCPQVTVIARCDHAEKGIEAIENLKPQIVFLDIEMPETNGFVMLQQLKNRNFELIFVTAYNHYAIKAIRFSALDYLLKPVEAEELKAAVHRAEQAIREKSGNPQIELLLDHLEKRKLSRIAIPTSDGLQFIQLDQIIYLEANANYTNIFLPAGKHLVSRPLKEFEEILPADFFIRIHHSYIINKNAVEKYIRGEGGQVVLQNGNVLDVSKRKKLDFLQAIRTL